MSNLPQEQTKHAREHRLQRLANREPEVRDLLRERDELRARIQKMESRPSPARKAAKKAASE